MKPSEVGDILISKDNRYIFTANYLGSLIDITQRKEIYKIVGPGDESIRDYIFSDNSEYFAYSFYNTNTIVLVNLKSSEIRYIDCDESLVDPTDFFFFNDSKYLIVNGYRAGVYIVDIQQVKPVANFHFGDNEVSKDIYKKQDGTYLIGVLFNDFDQPPYLGLYSMSIEQFFERLLLTKAFHI